MFEKFVCVGDMVDYCIFIGGKVNFREEGEDEEEGSNLCFYRVVQNGYGEIELVWVFFSVSKCGRVGYVFYQFLFSYLVSDYVYLFVIGVGLLYRRFLLLNCVQQEKILSLFLRWLGMFLVLDKVLFSFRRECLWRMFVENLAGTFLDSMIQEFRFFVFCVWKRDIFFGKLYLR